MSHKCFNGLSSCVGHSSSSVLDWKEHYDMLVSGGSVPISKETAKQYTKVLTENNCIITTGNSQETIYMRPLSVVVMHEVDAVIVLFGDAAGNRSRQVSVAIMEQEDGTHLFQCEITE